MQHARLYSLVGGVVAGASLSSFVTYTWYSAVFVWFGFVSTAIVLFVVIQRLKFLENKNFSRYILIAVCVFGIFLGLSRSILWRSFNHTNVLDNELNKKISITGIVIEEPQISDSSSKIIIETIPEKAKILVTADRYTSVVYGDEIKIFGKIIKPKPIQSEEGNFAYDVYLARQGIFYTTVFPGISIVSHHHGNIVREYLIKIKNNFLGKINELFVSPKSGLLAGLLVSGRSSLSKFEQTQFTQAGLIHIVALSGFNVTIIAQGLMALLIFFPKKLRLIIGALGIIAFMVMTGFGSTIVRAGIMALLVIVSALVYRTYHVGRALFVAVLCMVLWNPMVVFDISFQLSCIATFAVIFAVEPALLKYSLRFKFLPGKYKIKETILGTAVIEIFLLPILLSTSGQISLVTVITNMLVLPILPVVMGFGFIATLLGYIHSVLALPIVAISSLMLEYILVVTKFFANIPYGVVQYKIPEWAVLAMYGVLSFWLWRLYKFKIKNFGTTKNTESKSPLTSQNLERLDNFFRSHSN